MLMQNRRIIPSLMLYLLFGIRLIIKSLEMTNTKSDTL